MAALKKIVSVAIWLLLLSPVISSAQKNVQAKLTIDFRGECQLYDRMIFGQFIEHFHRQVYGGIFEPGSKLSDDRVFEWM